MRLPFGRLRPVHVLLAGPIAWLVWTLVHRVAPSDALALVIGARPLADCVSSWSFPCEGVTQFPLSQHAPAVVLVWLGIGIDGSLRAFEIMAVIAVLLTIVVPTLVMTKRQGTAAGVVTALVLIPTPLLYYSATSWGEPVAVALNLALVLCFVLRLPVAAVFLAAIAAGTAKEVAFPTILVVGGACALFAYGGDRKKLIWSLGALAAGAVVAQILAALLNLARYGTVSNALYTSIPSVPGFGLRTEIAAGLWFAPGGGVLAYWPTFAVVIGILLLASVRAWRVRMWFEFIPPALLWIGLAINTAILASWFAPFGWVAWGPRLMLPWLPAIAVATIFVAPQAVATVAKALFSRPLSALAVALVAAFGVIVNVAARTTGAWAAFFVPNPADPVCPRGATIGEPDYYYTCLRHGMWSDRSPIRFVLDHATTPVTLPWIALLTATVIGLVALGYLSTSGHDVGSLWRRRPRWAK